MELILKKVMFDVEIYGIKCNYSMWKYKMMC